ncbi:cysteine desulfurase /L-selenocysteine selenide-lyase (L-alanine-forming) [Cyclonatronum proteinivorum]|uniref:cysteine desulfurase n=1 Tax=Cyclonatronum proteinivorum TaxID=1457365 RepID=A0A345UK48_9BACT|nr:cysteine desulfurase [Cyclonatronum proteinivorum]AXJ00850.1 cysteine desulfurase /L-selenocysteine selenide-lyase (L-alanine-forming) [Cyclonatronum proteinivorum]
MNESLVNTKATPGRILQIRRDFPVLERQIHDKPLVYLDNAASTQMPRQVIETVSAYHTYHHSNVHRGVHQLSQEATDLYEGAREKVRAFIGASSVKEIIFTSGTTDAINLVANSWGNRNIGRDDIILISNMEHHANIVPWYMLAKRTGAKIEVIPVLDDGSLDMDQFAALVRKPNVKVVCVNHVSNALGSVNPVEQICQICRERDICTVIDGAQAIGHFQIDVNQLGADFYAFSGHKMHGPTGIGILYGREELLQEMDPYKGGGDMILSVSFDHISWNELPYKFEAGTPAIAQAVGLGAAVDYLNGLDRTYLAKYEDELLAYATKRLGEVPGMRLIGTAPQKVSLNSFVIKGVHPHDIGSILDGEGVAVRTGQHCAEPVMDRFCIPATTRASMSIYNTFEEIDMLTEALLKVTELFDVND